MRDRVARLRIWLLGSAVFLLLVIAAFIGYARFLSGFRHLKLPAKLGIEVKSDTSGWTLSQYDDKLRRTIYTIHAGRQTEFKNGLITLHDVSIVVYGRKGNRADRIYGDEFEYDQKEGVVRATGLVHMDVQAASAGGEAVGARENSGGAKVIHVTTSGLVYMQKLGVAATSEYIEFQEGAMKGHATGADYSSDSGLLMLHSAVSMSGFAGGQPVSMTASTAELDDRSQQAFLTHAKYESPGRTADAEQATLHMRSDGTLARVQAQGNVTIATRGANGATVTAQRADAVLNAASQPESAVLTGAVTYASDAPLRQAKGQANEVSITFDKQAKPQPAQTVFTGAVHMTERTRATDAVREPWSVRDLTAERFEALLAPVGERASELRTAEATGNARLTLVDNGSLENAKNQGTTEFSADELTAHLSATGGAKQRPELDTIAGRGHTVLHQFGADGAEQTSTGDMLDATFRPVVAKSKPQSTQSKRENAEELRETLASAVQQGHVTITRRTPAKDVVRNGTPGGARNAAKRSATGGNFDVERAVAERAAYDGETNHVTLSGGVRMMDAGSVLWANQLTLDKATGDAQAAGAVKVDYAQDSVRAGFPVDGEVTHIVADRAELDYAAEVATFHGKPVRLWQGGSQVQAPVIELSQQQKRLIARGEAATGWAGGVQAAQVHTVLMSSGGTDAGAQAAGTRKGAAASCGSGKQAAGRAGAAGAPQAVRIASGGLIYSGILGQADFTGGVRADFTGGERADAEDTTVRASQATATLQPLGAPGPAGGAAAMPSLAGNLERVVATQHVTIERPGLEATGERLVYTARDRVLLLTGDKNAPPKAVDAQGTTTGAALRFSDSCEAGGGVSVEALGEISGLPAEPVRTDSRVSDDRKKEKGKK